MVELASVLELEAGPGGPVSATPTFEIWKTDPKQTGCAMAGMAKLELKPTKLMRSKQ